jgi:plasmid stability protein
MPVNLSIKNVPDDIAERLRLRAAAHHRSLQGELMAIIEAEATHATKASVPIAMNFLGALGRLDFDAAALLLDDDAILELPYVNDGLIMRGRADIIQFFRRTMGKSVSGIVYRLEQAYPSPEAGAIVLEISTQGLTATGRQYTNRLVGVFVFRGGKIRLFREYFNSAKIG